MRILSIRIHQLRIPFTFELAHSMASRAFSDSLIVEVRTENASGFGEAVVRDYVSGRLSDGDASEEARLGAAADIVARLALPMRGLALGWDGIRALLETAEAEPRELPILCGLEGAILDAACREENADVYDLLGLKPARTEMRYGVTVPFITPGTRDMLKHLLAHYGPPDVRVKVGSDPAYADDVLGMVRGVLGPACDMRVDVNAGWSWDGALAHIPILRKHGVRLVEEPFGRNREENLRFMRGPASGFTLVADESALTPEDTARLGAEGAFSMVNIRLAKNGGLLRALRMADAARKNRLSLQVGCHVGETGILSATGRVLASLLPDAAYLDGSYDGIILAGNVTEESITFGPSGRVKAGKGRGPGYRVSREYLDRYTSSTADCG